MEINIWTMQNDNFHSVFGLLIKFKLKSCIWIMFFDWKYDELTIILTMRLHYNHKSEKRTALYFMLWLMVRGTSLYRIQQNSTEFNWTHSTYNKYLYGTETEQKHYIQRVYSIEEYIEQHLKCMIEFCFTVKLV